MSLTVADKQDIKVMIREEIKDLPNIAKVREIVESTVRKESYRLEQMIAGTKAKQNKMGQQVDNLDTTVHKLEIRIDETNKSVNRVELLIEDTNATVNQMLGMLSDNLKVKSRVDDHSERLASIETVQTMLVSTVTKHSKKLKNLN